MKLYIDLIQNCTVQVYSIFVFDIKNKLLVSQTGMVFIADSWGGKAHLRSDVAVVTTEATLKSLTLVSVPFDYSDT